MVVVKGNIDSVQTSLDFFIKVNYTDLDYSSKELRDKFFAMFKEDDLSRSDDFLVFKDIVKEDYVVNTSATPELVGEEVDFSECTNLVWGNDYSLDEEDASLEKEKNYLDTEKESSILSRSILEIEKNDDSIDEDDFIDYSDGEEDIENWGESKEEEDFGNWSESVEDEDDFIDYGVEDSQDEEEGSFDSWSSDDSQDEDTDEFIDYGYEEVDSNSSDDFENDEQNTYNWGTDEEIEEDYVKPLNSIENTFESYLYSESKESHIEESSSEEPKDLRDFVKKHPNCDMSLALKYFSKREIDKQLSLGRVFKRKNKLLI